MADTDPISITSGDSPNALAESQPRRSVVASARWLLLGLFVLCIVPRVLMVRKITDVCPDGVLYIQLAKALEHGDVQGSLREMRLNTFPVLLLGMHRLGLDWELAGKIWGSFPALRCCRYLAWCGDSSTIGLRWLPACSTCSTRG